MTTTTDKVVYGTGSLVVKRLADATTANDLKLQLSPTGLTASLAAGIPTVVTLNDYHQDENFDGARLVLHETDELTLDKLRLWHATASTS